MLGKDLAYEPAAPVADHQIGGQADGRNEYFGVPQQAHGFCSVAGERIEIALLWLRGQGHAFADAQDGAYDKADDHGPAGSAEEVVPVTEGQPDETGAKGDGDAIVGVAAEDAHQQHQCVPPAEGKETDAVVLPDEEGHDALGGQPLHGLHVALAEGVGCRKENEQEQRSHYQSFGLVVPSDEAGGEAYQQHKQHGQTDDDGPCASSIPAGGGDEHQYQQ